MNQPKPMLSVAEALDFLLAGAVAVTDTETLPTLEANGRVLALAQQSTLDVPPMDSVSAPPPKSAKPVNFDVPASVIVSVPAPKRALPA